MIPTKCTAVGIVLRAKGVFCQSFKVVFVRFAEFVTVVRGVLCAQVVSKEWYSAGVVSCHDVCEGLVHELLIFASQPCTKRFRI